MSYFWAIVLVLLGLGIAIAMLVHAFNGGTRQSVVQSWRSRRTHRARQDDDVDDDHIVPGMHDAPTDTRVERPPAPITLSRVLCAALAWVPLWFFTFILWYPITGWYADGYTVWLFLWGTILAGVLGGVAKSKGNEGLMKLAAAFGALLVLVATWETFNTFGASSDSTRPEVTADLSARCDDMKAELKRIKAGPDDAQDKVNIEALEEAIDEGCATDATPSATPTATPTPTPADCSATWEYEADEPINYAVVNGGLESIRNAATRADAHPAARDWVNEMKLEKNKLSYAIHLVLKETVNPASLVEGTCANDKAAAYVPRMIDMLDRSYIVPDEAPADGTNTGYENGQVVASAEPGITGDKRAIKVVLPDGRIFWILGRCGNPVFLGEVDLPKGNTDQVLQPAPTTSPPPTGGGAETPPPAPSPTDKNDAENVVTSDRNHTDERVRPNEPTAPPTVVRPEPTSDYQPPPPAQPTIEDQPEVQQPAPVNGDGSAPPTNSGDPATDGDTSGDGIPD